MSRKIIIAKQGYNALTETDNDNLVFSTDYNTLKYYVSGSYLAELPENYTPFTQENVVATHNLGYYPFFTAYWSIGGSIQSLPFGFADAGAYIMMYVFVSTTQLIFRFETTGWGGTDVQIWYKIFKNNLDL